MVARAAYVIAVLFAVILAAAPPALAENRGPVVAVALSPAPLPELARLFASCTGRMTAELADRWLMGGDAEAVERLRDNLADLAEAATPPDHEVAARALRIEARAAQADLLMIARFGAHPRMRERAAETAARLVTPCRGLVVP